MYEIWKCSRRQVAMMQGGALASQMGVDLYAAGSQIISLSDMNPVTSILKGLVVPSRAVMLARQLLSRTNLLGP